MMRGWNGYGWYHDGLAMGFPWAGILLGVLLLAIVALLVVLAIRVLRRPAHAEPGKINRALEILAERYARGEIDAATLRAMKSELEGGPVDAKP